MKQISLTSDSVRFKHTKWFTLCRFFKKHDPNYPMTEIVGDSFTSIIDTNFNFSGEWNDGYIESPQIGPAASWDFISLESTFNRA